MDKRAFGAGVPTYSQKQVQIEALIPLRFQRISMGFPARSPSHRHAFHEIGITLSGGATHFCGGKKFVLEPGWFYLLAPGETHRLETRSPWVVENIYYLPDHLVASPVGKAPGPGSSLLSPRHFWPQVGPLCQRLSPPAFRSVRHLLSAVQESPLPRGSGFSTHLFFSLLMILEESLWGGADGVSTPPMDARLRSALGILEDQLEKGEGPGVQALVSALGLTREYASTYFHKTMGCTIRDYLMKRRIARASHDLALGKPVGEVARAHGFFDAAHFTHRFQKVMGCTPKDYREGVRKEFFNERRPH